MRKRIYICGPISSGPLLHNVRQADDVFFYLLRAGFAPLCPHWSVYAGSAEEGVGQDEVWSYARVLPRGTKHEDWMGVDLPWVSVSDAVFRLPGVSVGADRETALASKLGIPVFENLQDLQRHFRQLEKQPA